MSLLRRWACKIDGWLNSSLSRNEEGTSINRCTRYVLSDLSTFDLVHILFRLRLIVDCKEAKKNKISDNGSSREERDPEARPTFFVILYATFVSTFESLIHRSIEMNT